MNPLICEMCGSHDVVKQNGVFVCQYCGTKYSVEEARTMMVEGTVKIDNSDRLSKLYHLARRARLEDDEVNASKYYSMVLESDPTNWEATFFSTYFSAMRTNIAGISSAAYRIAKCIPTTLVLIKENIEDADEKRSAVLTVADSIFHATAVLFKGTMSHYKRFSNAPDANKEKNERVNSTIAMAFIAGDSIEAMFADDTELCANSACLCWKIGFTCYESCDIPTPDRANEYVEKIRKYDPDYVCEKDFKNTNEGCYVATAIYGSYDCPQVWTLRRYRDYTLAETWHGRTFIHIYYAVSPILVEWFGHTAWFKKMWKGRLDRMVANLNANGVENTPYTDRIW